MSAHLRAAVLTLVLSAASLGASAQSHASPSSSARLTGTITVSIGSTRLKHWGMPGAEAAFVPDEDRSPYAARIRAAASARELCAALAAASGKDSRIATTAIDGDGSFQHRSGDEAFMTFILVVAKPAAQPRGSLYVCSRPAFAMMSRGAYPRERFHQVAPIHRLDWKSPPLVLHPGESLPVHFTWSVDASSW
jgi:hypothetical protein